MTHRTIDMFYEWGVMPAVGAVAGIGEYVFGFLAHFRPAFALYVGDALASLLTSPIVVAALVGFAGVCVQVWARLRENEHRRENERLRQENSALRGAQGS